MLNTLDKIILFLLLLSLLVIASKGCENNMALDMETMKCVDINLTFNPAWVEFY